MADSTSLGDLLAGIGAGQSVVNRPALNAAVQQGQALSGLRTQQTEDAMLNAQRMREEQDASDNLEDSLVNMTDENGKPMMTPSQARFTATQAKMLHGGAAPALQAIQDALKLRNSTALSNPNAPVADRVAAAQGNGGKFDVGQFSNVGDQLVNNVDAGAAANPAGPAVVQTPVSQANIAQKAAQAAQENAQTGLITNETNNPALYHPTGANNPNGGAGGGGNMGAIAKRYALAAATAGEQLGVEIQNNQRLPWGASTGVLGIGDKPGNDLLSTPIASLKNQMSGQDTQLYNASATNMGRFMASLEKGGRPITKDEGDSATAAFTVRPGDTNLTRLEKTASLSAHAQAALDSYIKFYGNELDPDQLKYFKDLKNQIATSIPYGLDEVAALQKTAASGRLDNATVGQFFVKHHMGTIPPDLAAPNAPGGPAGTTAPATGGPSDFSHLWN